MVRGDTIDILLTSPSAHGVPGYTVPSPGESTPRYCSRQSRLSILIVVKTKTRGSNEWFRMSTLYPGGHVGEICESTTSKPDKS